MYKRFVLLWFIVVILPVPRYQYGVFAHHIHQGGFIGSCIFKCDDYHNGMISDKVNNIDRREISIALTDFLYR